MMIGNYNIHRILVDNGSSADILFLPAFEKMKIEQKRVAPAPHAFGRLHRRKGAPSRDNLPPTYSGFERPGRKLL
jgi:hypothetical protein